jgi:formylglycine-generating enzyme required for sulfatase activity
MPVDFKQIKKGEDFELLCEDLLRAMGFTIVHQSARGPEGGKDLIVSETVTDRVGVSEEHRTLVQCKHHAHSGKAVGFNEVANYRDVMDQYGVRRYLLISSTVPTEDLREKFEKTSERGGYIASLWSRGDLARFLDAHPDVRNRHFPPPPGPTPADDLAHTIEGLLTVMGFTCQDRQPAEDRVRLVCTSKAPLARPVVVVCREGTLTRDDVEALLVHVKAQGLGGGVLVTHTRVSPAARERAAETGSLVRTFTLDEFYRELVDFEPYVRASAAQLYQVYTDLWLKRDEEKGRTLITRTDKRLFMQELALEMLRREELSIHYSQLPERVRAHFRLAKAAEIDYFEHDIRTCSFLNRGGEGNYYFVHKSLGEFFVAQWLVPKLLDGRAPKMRINEEVRGFVYGLLAERKWPPPPPPGVVVPEGMAWVPPGPFIMGGSEGLPVQVARIEQGFFIARTPVTNAEYARFVAATGHMPPIHWEGRTPTGEWRDHPVMYVDWDDAVAYAEWAGGRLPTEQEWEKAARGIDGRIYPWGDEFDAARCNAEESGIGTTTPVGRYSPGGDSPCGCADMAGNVGEWTASEYEIGRAGVLRGGSWDCRQRYVRCAARIRLTPDDFPDYVGLRVVVALALPPSES